MGDISSIVILVLVLAALGFLGWRAWGRWNPSKAPSREDIELRNQGSGQGSGRLP